ncbi:helicase-related protein [Modicisalibacter xianhensis]|uniref:SNF2 family N-terminal domain-containing protein n=1 Tax=Modicisalibacter xianhensis TaxID=442341 RepID=A0A1I2ZLN8_9GAMM|nr:helicase-related protein [Halomonas xianhensis]SFH38565.1 SNF2 family N-terminal domain-containing protein [Halomonas xianhensis]
MVIRDFDWKHSYATSDIREDGKLVDILHDFYIPALSRATRYDRVAGYFTSSSLAAASQGFSRFVENGGVARFVVGMQLDPEDAAAILRGDTSRADRVMLEQLDITPSWPDAVRHGVELLAWMVTQGYLSVRVGLRVHAQEGTPQPLDFAQDGYLHEKWFILGDEEDEIYISGSLNESRTALAVNAENITLQPSWISDWNRSILKDKHRSFEALWLGKHPAIKTFSLPEAVHARLVKIASNVTGLFEIDGTPMPYHPMPDQKQEVREADEIQPSLAERLRFAMIRLAPLLPGGEQVGIETTPIEPWPHQRFVANRLLETYPRNHLLCDEVGLGKTIEAGLAFRALWLSGRARSIRVFAPASLTAQWLVEMAEKFFLPFYRRTNSKGRWECIDMLSGETIQGDGKMFDSPLEIISTGLVINRHGGRLLAGLPETDLVLVDEAHKARRQTPDNQTAVPRFNKLYQELQSELYGKSRTLLLATATPMQLNRVEAFDLLKLMPSAGAVQFSEDLCEIFYRTRDKLLNREPMADYESEWLRRYLNDVRASSPEQWRFVHNHVLSFFGQTGLEDFVERWLEPMDWDEVQPALSLLAPLGRSMLRHTRSLLRAYQREGLLNANLAWREVHPSIVKLSGVEREVYDQLQDYCAELASHIAANMEEGRQRAAIGFYLSFLRLRYASSFYALRCSLERRLVKIRQTLDHKAQQFANSDIDREELEEMSDEEVEGLVLKHRTESDLTWEQGAVSRLLATMDRLPSTPRKMQQLLQDIDQRRVSGTDRVRQLVLFTRYADTMNYLHDELRRLLPRCPMGTFSGAGGTLRRAGEYHPERMDRTTIKQSFVGGNIDILLCTDAAAEGLNLQSADLLINFDLPWNPMMLEQRIGRIDRIGQHHEHIRVLNYLYQDSVEEVVYSRLVQRFREALTVSGELQFSLLPIQPEDFEDYAKADGEQGKIDEEELLCRAYEHAKRIKERQQLTEFKADEQKAAYEALEAQQRAEPLPATLELIWSAISESKYLRALGGSIESFRHGDAFSLVDVPGLPREVLLTTSRDLFEHGLGQDDHRRLHFATYGDPVFEKLLDYMLQPLTEVQTAWQNRKPLVSIRIDNHELRTLEDALDTEPPEDSQIELKERSLPLQGRQDDRVGRQQKVMLNSASASLASQKLNSSPDSQNNQISEIDRFRVDVNNRHGQRVHLNFDTPDRNSMLAVREKLLWPVAQKGNGLVVDADPLLLTASRDVIFRQLGDRNCRTSHDVARRLTIQAEELAARS